MNQYLYLAIAESNIPCIFSCENISPKSFYEQGLKIVQYSFHSNTDADSLHQSDTLLLYETIPFVENSKIVYLQIDKKICDNKHSKMVADNVLAYFTTIFFSEKNCIVYCQNETQKENILGLIYSNAKIKKYKVEVIKEVPKKVTKLLNPIENPYSITDEIAKTSYTNHYKGLLTGFALSSFIKTTPEKHLHLQILMKQNASAFDNLRTTLVTTSSLSSGKYTPYPSKEIQKFPQKQLLADIKKAEELYFELLPNEIKLYEEKVSMLKPDNNRDIEAYQKQNISKVLIERAKKLHYYTEATDFQFLIDEIDEYVNFLTNGASKNIWVENAENDIKNIFAEISKKIDIKLKEVIENMPKTEVNSDIFSSKENGEITLNFSENSLSKIEKTFLEIVLTVLCTTIYRRTSPTEVLRETKANIMREIYKIVAKKEEMGGYLKDLIDLGTYVQDKDFTFKIENQESEVLKSLACFLIKPDKLTDLHEFLNNKKIIDKQMSIMFWCAWNGYGFISYSDIEKVAKNKINLEKDLQAIFDKLTLEKPIKKLEINKEIQNILASPEVKSPKPSAKKITQIKGKRKNDKKKE
jgi:hypothetical protein